MADTDLIASQLISAYDRSETLEPFTSADSSFDMAQGYAVLHEILRRRLALGARVVEHGTLCGKWQH